MILRSNFNIDNPADKVTIDDKRLTELSERDLDNLRRRIANYIRTNNIPADDLAHIFSALIICQGEWEMRDGKYVYDHKTLTL